MSAAGSVRRSNAKPPSEASGEDQDRPLALCDRDPPGRSRAPPRLPGLQLRVVANPLPSVWRGRRGCSSRIGGTRVKPRPLLLVVLSGSERRLVRDASSDAELSAMSRVLRCAASSSGLVKYAEWLASILRTSSHGTAANMRFCNIGETALVFEAVQDVRARDRAVAFVAGRDRGARGERWLGA